MNHACLKYILVVCSIICATTILPARAADPVAVTCNSYSPLETMFKDVCWSGMFPMILVGSTIREGRSGLPADRNRRLMCRCGGKISEGKMPKVGLTFGFWAPAKIIDVTRKPYCMASLNGLQLPFGSMDFLNGGANLGRARRHEAFANWVMYSAPLAFMLRIIDEEACPPDGLIDFDVVHSSPLFPSSNDAIGRYTTFLNPEMLLFANPVAIMALPVDATAVTLTGSPNNNLFWVAGTWGQIYPITGFGGHGKMSDPVKFSSLIATRSVALLHRLGLMSETIGEENICERQLRFIIRKDAVRWQMLAPSPETNGRPAGAPPVANTTAQVREVSPPARNNTCNHATGAATAGWGMWRDVPSTGEDHVYLLFQWTDCCFGITTN